MRFTKWGEYGILCCLYLAKAGANGSVGAAELAEHHSIPLQYAQQILQRLRKGGVITSTRGPGGGYKLSRDPSKINLKDILIAAEGNTFEVICDFNSISIDICKTPNACALHNTWRELKNSIEALLEERTLAVMLKSHQTSEPRPSLESSNSNYDVEADNSFKH